MTDPAGTPTPQQVRRALARVERGAALDVDEATVLLTARGEDLDRLTAAAARVRDAGLQAAGRPGTVTYSPKVFIPLTRLCRDRCHYCTFVTTPGHLERTGDGMYLSPDEVLEIARQGAALGCKEALFTLGDRPEDRWPQARAWLDEQGYDSTLDYVRAMAVRVLEETGLLPHLNPGVMSWQELNRLKPVAPSMGMMLETTSTRLFTEKGQAHHGSPDKDPAVRLRVLEDAGRLNVPFTTGILVGIGETVAERADSVFAIRRIARQYGNVQEVIVQNFRAKPDTAMRHEDDLGLEEYLATIAVARIVLGPKMRIQAPPNLVDSSEGSDECLRLLGAGIDDWGGVSPVTPDHVNPERPWPSLERLRTVTAEAGFELRERLTVHPEYVRAGEPWIDPRLSAHVAALADHDGLGRDGVRPAGLPWQEPDGGFAAHGAGTGRTDLHASIDTEGRTADRRDDFDSVYGDWDVLREGVSTGSTTRDASTTRAAAPDGDVRAALAAAERDPAGLSDEQAYLLMTADWPALEEVCALADGLRRHRPCRSRFRNPGRRTCAPSSTRPRTACDPRPRRGPARSRAPVVRASRSSGRSPRRATPRSRRARPRLPRASPARSSRERSSPRARTASARQSPAPPRLAPRRPRRRGRRCAREGTSGVRGRPAWDRDVPRATRQRRARVP
jgi:FO synthase